MTVPPSVRRSLATLAGASLFGASLFGASLFGLSLFGAGPLGSAPAGAASWSGAAAGVGVGVGATPSSGRVEAQRVAAGFRLRRLTPAEVVLGRMSPAQVVGQVFMVGTPATSAGSSARAQIGRLHVGNVMLTGRSEAGTRRPARVAALLQSATTAAATRGVRLLVATDQEGGHVQVLRGPGLSAMPSGLAQGQWGPGRLAAAAERWGRELRAAGVNMNLAPVLDTVPGGPGAAANPPIGAFDRQYGSTPGAVLAHGSAFARGMSAAGVVPTVKHFPGLGRVRANPDVSAGVQDSATGRRDATLTPFRRAVDGGAPVVMMSTATYPRLDPAGPAAFSRRVVEGLLRHELGFDGVVVSDDLGNARQVARFGYGARAVRFLRAGGDLVLTVNPGTLPAMHRAVLTRSRTSGPFRERVEQAALRVLRLKQKQGLLHP